MPSLLPFEIIDDISADEEKFLPLKDDAPCLISENLIGDNRSSPTITEMNLYARAVAPILCSSLTPKYFDKTFHFPGLYSLYRRNCATRFAHDTGSKGIEHSNFGDYVLYTSLPCIGKSEESALFSLFGDV